MCVYRSQTVCKAAIARIRQKQQHEESEIEKESNEPVWFHIIHMKPQHPVRPFSSPLQAEPLKP